MKRFLIPLLAAIALPSAVNSEHLKGPKELTVTSESTKESIALAKYLKDNLDTEFDISRKWASQNYSILKKRLAEEKVAGVIEN